MAFDARMTPQLSDSRRGHRLDGRGGVRRSVSRDHMPRTSSGSRIAGFVLMLIAGARLRAGRAADRDGGAVPDAGDLPRDAGAAARTSASTCIWILPLLGLILSDRGALAVVAAGALAMAADHVGGAGRDRLADRVSARSRLRALDSAAASGCRTPASASARGRSDRTSPTSRLVHNLGILFIDALCRWYAAMRATRFRRDVLAALAAAAAIAAVVAVYQGFVDLTFPEPAVLGLHDSRVRNAGGSEQARRGHRVLDGRRDGARATPAAAVVSRADVSRH